MYIFLMRIGRFFRELSPIVTAATALLFAMSYIILISLELDDDYGIYYQVLMAVPAGFFIIWAGVKALARKSQINTKSLKPFRNSEQFQGIFNHCIHIDKGCLCLHKRLEAKASYKWPENDQELAKISKINAAAFRGTPWAGGVSEKLKRNLAMWQKNPNSFLMIMEEDAAQNKEPEPLFFSHILPLSDHGYHHYFETAESGDNEFHPGWVAEPGSKIKGLLLFTIARDPDRGPGKKMGTGDRLPEYLYAVAYHIQAILDHYPDEKQATIYFQNSEKKFKRLAELAGFKKSRLLTYDEETVYVVSVENHPVPVS